MTRPTYTEIDLAALRHNCHIAQQASPGSKIIAVVKANAYGHGAVTCCHTIQNHVDMFAVSSLQEALLLRTAQITLPILLLEGCFDLPELEAAIQHGFEVVFHHQYQLDMLAKIDTQALASSVRPIRAWLKVDTGMHRLGVPVDDAAKTYAQLQSHPLIAKNPVLMTHLAVSDELRSDYTLMQLRQFQLLLESLPNSEHIPTSIGNSGGMMDWPQCQSDWARPGIMIYGISPFGHNHPVADKLTPVMSLRSKIISLRDVSMGSSVGYGCNWRASKASKIAIVPVGYGDGYPRHAKNGTPVLVNGQRAPLVGRVSMDMLSVDVTDISDVDIGDDVELWGQNLPVNEVAKHADTIGYELITRMTGRAQRIYC